MNIAEILHKKIDELPEPALRALLEYVEFLLGKDHAELEDDETAKLTRQLLVKRYDAYQQNKNRLSKPGKSWEDEIRDKYGCNK